MTAYMPLLRPYSSLVVAIQRHVHPDFLISPVFKDLPPPVHPGLLLAYLHTPQMVCQISYPALAFFDYFV
jgi:hypothetical protein